MTPKEIESLVKGQRIKHTDPYENKPSYGRFDRKEEPDKFYFDWEDGGNLFLRYDHLLEEAKLSPEEKPALITLSDDDVERIARRVHELLVSQPAKVF